MVRLLAKVSPHHFRIAHDVSSYSFAALAKAGLPMMQGRNGALLTLSYLGAVRCVPHYNVMGLAKASLEANVRYLAQSLGPKGILRLESGIPESTRKALEALGWPIGPSDGGFGRYEHQGIPIYNVSVVDESYRLVNAPTVIDLPGG